MVITTSKTKKITIPQIITNIGFDARIVPIYRVVLELPIEQNDIGGLRAFFKVNCWRVNRDGLIYGNDFWLNDFRRNLGNAMGVKFHDDDLEYSEQGLQGNNYVHLDVSSEATKFFLTGNKQSLRRAKSPKPTTRGFWHFLTGKYTGGKSKI